jgi:hypothetical protein
MRKRIIIGLLAVVVIGAVVFYLSQPKRGSVEWHKERYLAAIDTRWKYRFERLRSKILGDDQRGVQIDAEGLASNEAALIELGFLERRELTVSNREPLRIMHEISGWSRSSNSVFFRYRIPATNRVVWVAVREDMPKWEELIQKADMPENGK